MIDDGMTLRITEARLPRAVLLFGATGMVGQGVLRECLLDPAVQTVLAVGRSATGIQHPKLRDLVHRDLSSYESIESQLSGFDACFFCLGVSSTGMREEEYERITYGITLAAAICPLPPEPGDDVRVCLGRGHR